MINPLASGEIVRPIVLAGMLAVIAGLINAGAIIARRGLCSRARDPQGSDRPSVSNDDQVFSFKQGNNPEIESVKILDL